MSELIETPDGPQRVDTVLISTSDHGGTFLRRVMDKAQEWNPTYTPGKDEWFFADTTAWSIARAYAKAHDTTHDVWYNELLTGALNVLSDKLPKGYRAEHGRFGVEIVEDFGEIEDPNTTLPTHYGSYEITLSFPTRDGRWFILGFDEHAAQPYCTGVMPGSLGGYYGTPEAARHDFLERIVEDAGMVLGPAGSLVVRREDAEILTGHAKTVADHLHDWDTLDRDREDVANDLVATAQDLGTQMRSLGLFTEKISRFED